MVFVALFFATVGGFLLLSNTLCRVFAAELVSSTCRGIDRLLFTNLMVWVINGDNALEGGISFLASDVSSHLSVWFDCPDPALDLHSHPPKVSFNLSSITPDDSTFGGRPSSLSRPIIAIT
jgi:hypothetical protein